MKESNYLISAQILKEQRDALNVIGTLKGKSMASLIREALEEYISNSVSKLDIGKQILVPIYKKRISPSSYGFFILLYSKLMELKLDKIKFDDIKKHISNGDSTDSEKYTIAINELLTEDVIRLKDDEYYLTGLPGNLLTLNRRN